MLQRTVTAVLDLLFPRRCAACDAAALQVPLPFCADCAATLQPVQPEHCCRRCAMPQAEHSNAIFRCRHCAAWPVELATVRAPLEYGGALAEAIIRLKWQARDDLAQPLATLLRPLLQSLLARSHIDVIVPVPLHPTRVRERGYNQAWLLAEAALAGLPRSQRPPLRPDLLLRLRPDPPTRNARHSERIRRTGDAFTAPQPRRLTGQRVLLIDDVVTSGATLSACARALHYAGAPHIQALTLARTT